MPRDEATLLDILSAARRAIQFGASVSRQEFLSDLKTQSAVLHQLLVLGEAVKRLSPEFRQRHPGIPWRQAAGMRDIVIHNYDGVDLSEVYRTLERDLPALIKDLTSLLPVPED